MRDTTRKDLPAFRGPAMAKKGLRGDRVPPGERFDFSVVLWYILRSSPAAACGLPGNGPTDSRCLALRCSWAT